MTIIPGNIPLDDASELVYKLIMEKEATMFVVFDLDGTVIDSSHRQLTKPDGSLDLAHWREHCTPEKIAADKLLPLARSIRAIANAGNTVIVCTARVMTAADLQYLDDNNLPYDALLCRDGPDDWRSDVDLKIAKLTEFAQTMGFDTIKQANFIMFDDNLKILEGLAQYGVTMVNATNENRRLGA